jgi:hypothetical protein
MIAKNGTTRPTNNKTMLGRKRKFMGCINALLKCWVKKSYMYIYEILIFVVLQVRRVSVIFEQLIMSMTDLTVAVAREMPTKR